MKKSNQFEKDLRFINSMAEAMGSSEDESIDEIREDLAEEGINHDDAVKTLMSFVQKCSLDAKRKRLDIAADKRKKAEADNSAASERFSKLTKEELMSRIRDIIGMSELTPSLSYRELNSKNREDLYTILEDLETARNMENVDESKE